MTHPMYDLSGRTALITGGGGHIGGASAHALAAAGADVIIVDINEAAAEAMAEQIRGLGRHSYAITGDASRYGEVRRMADTALAESGHVDILVNVAGKPEPRTFLDIGPEDFDAVMQGNMMSAWAWSHCLAPHMLEREQQRIINISSISGKHGGGPPATVSKSAYAAAKAGVIGLTKGLAKELAPKITVNCICPGLIHTTGTSRITEGPDKDAILTTIPKARFGKPTDVAAAVLFFASPGADWITGETMDVNGGQYID